jgi:hypothetical protein
MRSPVRSCLCLILAVSAAPVLTACRHQRTARIYEDDDAYQVYSSILPDTNPLVIRAATATHDLCLKPLDDQAEKVLRPALDDYLRLNSESWLLREKFTAIPRYTILPEQELQAIFPGGSSGVASGPGWKTFVQRHPTYPGWIEVSAVGFNREKTVAVVYLGYHCGEDCAGGEFKALEKKDGKWRLLTGKGRWNHCFWKLTITTACAPAESNPS